jgi:branched-subunit amino acid ABC-type transport system permease component
MLGVVTGGQALNLLADGIINGAFYAAIGASFGLILTVTGRFHFAWATTFTVSAFVAAILTEQGDNFWLSLLAGAAGGGWGIARGRHRGRYL